MKQQNRFGVRGTALGLLLGLGATLVLSACVGQTSQIIYRKSFQESYNHTELMAYNGGKQMRLDVSGNPFSVSDDELSNRVSLSMNGRNEGIPIEFTSSPSEAVFKHNRIVVLFQPHPSALGRNACDGSVSDAGAGSGGGVEALMAFCWRGRERSSLRVRMGAINGPDDPTFDTMIGRATTLLLPLKNPFSGSETCAPDC